jgi:hypothetical protein
MLARALRSLTLVPFILLALPAIAFAQASIAGVVRDPSGAVMPGVTVEASSDALIERTRTAVTDSAGQYQIVNLPAGRYAVSFVLDGFTTVRREGVELTGNFTANIAAELRVGEVKETVTITGETPVVDTRSTIRQDVLQGSLITELPAARNVQNVAILIPGIAVTGTVDVGGLRAGADVNNFSAHGGRVDDGRLQLDGVTVGGPTGGAGANSGGGGTSYFQPDVGNAAEIAVTTSGALGEAESGGPQINVIPRSGGNRRSGSFFMNYGNSDLQGTNLTDTLRQQQAGGRLATEELIMTRDLTLSTGGPIKRDGLWYFVSGRTKVTEKRVPMFTNLFAGDPNSWRYEPDPNSRAFSDSRTNGGNLRLTWQASTRNKLNLYFDTQQLKDNHRGGGSATVSPEAAGTADAYPQHLVQTGWQAPWTSRLLLDATFSSSVYDYGGRERDGNPTRDLVRVTDTGRQGGVTGLTYRSMNWNENHAFVPRWKASAAYVTGSHNYKFGVQGFMQVQDNRNFTNTNDMSYTVRTADPNDPAQIAVPSSITMVGANPIRYRSKAISHSAYAQDAWTRNRLTLQGALRYDYAASSYPHQTFGGSRFHPAVYDFPTDTTSGITGFHDLNVRMGVIYDLTGDGKTSVKFNAGRYTDSASSDGRWVLGNPLSRLTTSVNRSWTDTNRNYVPDCDMLNPNAQSPGTTGSIDTCGAISNRNFGTPTQTFTTTYDPDMFQGWFTRPMDWQLGLSVQREVLPRVSVEAGWHRRWADKWTLIENVANTHADFDPYSYQGPVDARLGEASGRLIDDLWNITPTKFGEREEYTRLENNVPGTNRRNWWNGGDINVNARLANGLTLRGGVTAWKQGDDYCSYIENGYFGTGIAEGPGRRNCSTVTPLQAEYKALGTYVIPRLDVQVAATLSSTTGPAKAANVQVPRDVIAQTLGRFPSGSTPTSVTTINLFETNEAFYPQISIVDFRVGKILRFGRMRANIGVDIYNALNASTGQTYNNTYNLADPSTWGTPTLVLPARFAKFSAQIDF